MSGKLTIISTPIGNMGDISFRAVEELKNSDIILCEDTRHSGNLLNSLGIKKKLWSYHKFNHNEVIAQIIETIKNGKNMALMSDAGMPCISDPGNELVKELIKNKIPYTIVPGANAALSALVLSGFNSTHFTFVGFIPEKKTNAFLREFNGIKHTLIFYSSVHNITKDIVAMFEVFGERKIAVVREITKLHEEVVFTNLKDGYNGTKKGEFVIVCEGSQAQQNFDNLTIEEHIKRYVDAGLKTMDAIKEVAKDRGLKKSDVYPYGINIK